MSAHVFRKRKKQDKAHAIAQHKMCIRYIDGHDQSEAMFSQGDNKGGYRSENDKMNGSLLY